MDCQKTLEAMFHGMLQNEVEMTKILLALHNVSANGELKDILRIAYRSAVASHTTPKEGR